MSKTAEDMKNGARALCVMADSLNKALNSVADGMEKSTDGRLTGDIEEDETRALAADRAGFICHKLTTACMGFLSGFGDTHLKSDDDVKAFVAKCDANLDQLKKELLAAEAGQSGLN